MREIYRLLKNREIKIAICRMRNASGLYYDDESGDIRNYIFLNPKQELFSTLIHECLHALFTQNKLERTYKDKTEEEEVVILEEFCVDFLDHHHAVKLLKLMMLNLTPRSKIGNKKYDR